jgi:hypothetical protein
MGEETPNRPDNQGKSMMELFPINEFKRMVMHLDRFDTDVVTDERMNQEKTMDEIEKLSEKIIEENL